MLKDTLQRAAATARAVEQSSLKCAEFSGAQRKAANFLSGPAAQTQKCHHAVSVFTSAVAHALDDTKRTDNNGATARLIRLSTESCQHKEHADQCLTSVQTVRSDFSGEVSRLAAAHTDVTHKISRLKSEIQAAQNEAAARLSELIRIRKTSPHKAAEMEKLVQDTYDRIRKDLQPHLSSNEKEAERLTACQKEYEPLVSSLITLTEELQTITKILGAITHTLEKIRKHSTEKSSLRLLVEEMQHEVQQLQKFLG